MSLTLLMGQAVSARQLQVSDHIPEPVANAVRTAVIDNPHFLGPRKSVDLTSLLATSPSEAGVITEEPDIMTPSTTMPEYSQQDRAVSPKPNIEKRWSIQEVEEAYKRMKGLSGMRRPSNTGSAAMSVSTTEHSTSMDASYIRQLLEAGAGASMDASDRSM